MPAVILLLFMAITTTEVRAQAQNNLATVTGKVTDTNGEAVPYATIALYSGDGESLLDGTNSDASGRFTLKADPGNYVLKITALSFEGFEKKLDLDRNEIERLSVIRLKPEPESLDDIEVQAEKTRMQLRFDKRVFEVGTDVTTIGGTALNVLDNVPSITTDIEGVVSLRGSEGVRILINGKPSASYSQNDGSLRSLSSEMIEKVEVITNPSARYEAEGSAGIINIILKKNERRGLNGSVSAGVGYPQDYEFSTNLNYRVNKINWFINAGIDYGEDEDSGNSFQRFNSADTSYMYREISRSDESEIDGNVRFGADFFLPNNQTLTASASADLESGEEDSETRYRDMDLDGTINQQVLRNELEDQEESDFEFELAYENLISGDDHKLTADLDFDISEETQFSNQREEVLSGNTEAERIRTNSGESQRDLRFQADYVQNLGEQWRIESGLNSNLEYMESDYLEEVFDNGSWSTLNNLNENFVYREWINAAYGIVAGDFGAFSTQIGLRVEQSNVLTRLSSTGAENTQNYTDLFPSVFLNYEFNEAQSVQTSYSRRISRPWSRFLVPFSNWSDTRSRFVGNPELNPEFSDSYEIGFLQYWETGSLLSSVYYRKETGKIERITTLDQDGIRRTLPINLSTEKSWGIEFSADQTLFDVFTVNGNANFFKANTNGFYQGTDYSAETRSFSGRMRLEWDIAENIKYQSSIRYRGPRETSQGTRSARTSIDTGIAFELFSQKGVLSFNVRDLLDSSNLDYTASGPNFYTEREFSWSTRSFTLNFTYFFNRDNNRGGNRGGYNR